MRLWCLSYIASMTNYAPGRVHQIKIPKLDGERYRCTHWLEDVNRVAAMCDPEDQYVK